MAEPQPTTIPVPCPDCGEMSNELIAHVVELDVIPCSLCGGLIDLAAENCQPIVKRAKLQLASAPKNA
jgi:hypothetical protein